MNPGQIPLWFYIIMACAAVAGVLITLWVRISKKIKEREDKIKEDAEWRGKMDAHKSDVTIFIKEIREDIKRIFQRLPPAPVSSESPLALTEFGEQISKDLRAQNWAKKHAQNLLNKVTGSPEYEVYEYCVEYVKDEFKPTEEESAVLRKVAYNHGITVEQVLEVLIVELRDELLKLVSPDRKNEDHPSG